MPPILIPCSLELARARAAHILPRKFTSRESVKAKMLENQEAVRARMRAERESTRRRWKLKTRHSPFLVDLVAENERLEEENRKLRKASQAEDSESTCGESDGTDAAIETLRRDIKALERMDNAGELRLSGHNGERVGANRTTNPRAARSHQSPTKILLLKK